ncbi:MULTISPECIES: DUF6177 family protein [Nocardiopsidaceae]|uniref:DUF6177 family protein n=1 Tax=Streptomonospora nanhaiensis TaxID=1323731 RepID=A0ABY6YKZ1_9ACTN|nr:DUF6177 family protein [Streptomonospora nanhaiensis]WAE73034.1 DUF6177 family protein [Streptomonospora nanhaiensis]
MSYDVVALLAAEPGMVAVAHSLRDAGADLAVRPLDGGVVQLRDAEARVLATLEPAQLVESRGEVSRLLGAEAAVNLPDTCWWAEVRARPDAAGREAAHRVADGLALRLGGGVWTSGPGDFSLWEETGHPAVEFEAEEAFVVAQDREVVPLSSWITDAVSANALRGTVLQVLTPRSSRLTHGLRTLITQPMARWVVLDGKGGQFDGVSGLPLRWDRVHGYVPDARNGSAPEPACGFLDISPLGAHLLVDLAVRHGASFAPPLCRAVELVTGHLAGVLPAGWGPHEPALAPWDRERLVRLVRHRAPRTAVLQFSGHQDAGPPFTGGARVSWAPDGERAAERISLAIGFEDEGALPLGALPGLVEALAAENLLDVLHVRRARGRRDVTFEPRWHGLAAPVGMALGPDGVRRAGEEHALAGPLRGEPLGEAGARAIWYPAPAEATRQRAAEAVAAQLRHLTAAPRS